PPHLVDETALAVVVAPGGAEGAEPLVLVRGDEGDLAIVQRPEAFFILVVDGGQGELHADELGALTLSVLLAPIGEGQPRQVVVRQIVDGVHQAGDVGHGLTRLLVPFRALRGPLRLILPPVRDRTKGIPRQVSTEISVYGSSLPFSQIAARWRSRITL